MKEKEARTSGGKEKVSSSALSFLLLSSANSETSEKSNLQLTLSHLFPPYDNSFDVPDSDSIHVDLPIDVAFPSFVFVSQTSLEVLVLVVRILIPRT